MANLFPRESKICIHRGADTDDSRAAWCRCRARAKSSIDQLFMLCCCLGTTPFFGRRAPCKHLAFRGDGVVEERFTPRFEPRGSRVEAFWPSGAALVSTGDPSSDNWCVWTPRGVQGPILSAFRPRRWNVVTRLFLRSGQYLRDGRLKAEIPVAVSEANSCQCMETLAK